MISMLRVGSLYNENVLNYTFRRPAREFSLHSGYDTIFLLLALYEPLTDCSTSRILGPDAVLHNV